MPGDLLTFGDRLRQSYSLSFIISPIVIVGFIIIIFDAEPDTGGGSPLGSGSGFDH